jgi:hypothetical protein
MSNGEGTQPLKDFQNSNLNFKLTIVTFQVYFGNSPTYSRFRIFKPKVSTKNWILSWADYTELLLLIDIKNVKKKIKYTIRRVEKTKN